MNLPRLALAAVAATIWDVVFGVVVYGMLLSPEFAKYPAVYRATPEGMAYLPLMFGGIFIAIVVAVMIYAKGYEGGSGAAEGIRFGILLGVFVVFAFAGVNYGVLNLGRRLAVMVAAAGFVEWFGIGTIIGLTYRPAARSPR
jgi:hypothetical protein